MNRAINTGASSAPSRLATILGVIPAIVTTTTAATASTTIPLDPRATYLHTAAADTSQDTIPVALASLGLVPGDTIRLERLGGWDNGPGGDQPRNMMAVFSGSAALLGSGTAHRVPDAIVSAVTYYGSETTDIPEDFLVADASTGRDDVCIVVPTGATHLFVAPHDSLYEDNSDPNGDYAVLIELVECSPDCATPADGQVDVTDLLDVLGQWGQAYGDCDADCDGTVGVGDLLLVLADWGSCQ